MALPDPVIHLYWAYALARAEEMFKVTRFPSGMCGVQDEREFVTLHPKNYLPILQGASQGKKRAGKISQRRSASRMEHRHVVCHREH